eukprot:scaffold132743_cov63-Phaeocystis_antarctica.AAC.1
MAAASFSSTSQAASGMPEYAGPAGTGLLWSLTAFNGARRQKQSDYDMARQVLTVFPPCRDATTTQEPTEPKNSGSNPNLSDQGHRKRARRSAQ